jgi:hypothetical protein
MELIFTTRILEAISRPQVRFEGKAKPDEKAERWWMERWSIGVLVFPQYSTTPVLQPISNQCLENPVNSILRTRDRHLSREYFEEGFNTAIGP